MAYTVRTHCKTCGEIKDVWVASGVTRPEQCNECAAGEKLAKKYTYLAELAKLPIEERLEKIESQLYDLRHAPRTPISEQRF